MDPSDIRYAFLALGIWVSFLLFGYCQESLTRHSFGGQRFVWTQALVVAQSLGNVLVSGLVLTFSGAVNACDKACHSELPKDHSHKDGLGHSLWRRFTGGVPAHHWFITGLGYFGAHSFGLAALQHIIYPLQVVIKSCKAVPVLIGEVLITRSRPGLAKILSVVQLSAGVGLFMYFSDYNHKKESKDSTQASGSFLSSGLVMGVFLACGALVCDAIYGPYQNLICQRYQPNAWHLMFNMNIYQLIIALIVASTGTELVDAYHFVMAHPSTVGVRLAFFCGSMALGNVFIYQMQRDFGALAVAKTTTVRKLVSVTLSVLWFGHTLTLAQYGAIAVVFSAPLIEKEIAKYTKQAHHKKTDEAQTPKVASPAKDARKKTPEPKSASTTKQELRRSTRSKSRPRQ